MRSGTSFFDGTIYKKTVNRFWPLWAVNLVFWLFLLPFRGLMDLDPGKTGSYRFALNVGDMATDVGIVVALLGSLMVAMAVCSHLYNARSANFFGALPCRREGQFLSTYAAGLTMLIGPNVLIFVLALLVEVAGGFVVWAPLLFWLGALSAMEFFFYSFALCIGQFAGHILALPVFYGVFNAIVAALCSLMEWVFNAYYFGYAGITGFWPSLVAWCTPVAMFANMDIDVVAVGAGEVVDIENYHVCAVYAAVAVVLAVCALLLYRKRHLETAGDIVAVKAMRPVFQYGVAACAGLFFGFLMEQMFGLTEFGMALWMVVWGVIGYFVARMLLDKSIRVFKRWKGAVAVAVAFLLLFAVVGFDLTGYETRVPDPEDVVSVQFSGLQGEPSDVGYSVSQMVLTEHIDLITGLHQRIVDAGEDGEKRYDGNYGPHITFNVAYTLKDGSRLVRRYSVPMGEETLALAQQIRDLPEVRRHAYGLDELEQKLAQGGSLISAQLWDYTGEKTDYVFSGRTAQRLWEAVMADFEMGLIGDHTVGLSAEHQAYRVEFKFYVPADEVLTTAVGITEEVNGEPYAPADGEGWRSMYREFAVQEQSVHTLAVLKELIEPDNRYQEEPSLEDIMAGNARG